MKNFPNGVEAVGGKHVKFLNSKNSSPEFFNYKKLYSITLMSAVNVNVLFTWNGTVRNVIYCISKQLIRWKTV